MPHNNRKPRAIHLDRVRIEGEIEKPAKPKGRTPRALQTMPMLVGVADSEANGLGEMLTPALPAPVARRFSWGGLLLGALGGIVMLATGLAIDQLIGELFARNNWLGWAGTALAGLVVIATLALALRELWGLTRLRTLSRLRQQVQCAHEADDLQQARLALKHMSEVYASRPETAHGRSAIAEHAGEIIDGSDLIELGERELLAPLDSRARTMVLESAKRVSIVTAISPRALVDLAFVLMENVRLIRRISLLYGGKPGTLGFWRLARNVIMHLAATGVIAVGDGIVQQMIGHGLAAKLSARLGEGVINGLLTARIGIAAIDVCRPAPFISQRRPGTAEFLAELLKINGLQKRGGSDSFPADMPGRDTLNGRNMK